MVGLLRKRRFKVESADVKLTEPDKSEVKGLDRYSSFIEKTKAIIESSPERYGERLLSVLARDKEILQGVVFMMDDTENPARLRFTSGYACSNEFTKELSFEPGEGLTGQVFTDKKLLNLKDFPEGYIKVRTGLGEASPRSLLLFPLIDSEKPVGVIELASFLDFTEEDEQFYTAIAEEIVKQMKQYTNGKKMS